MPFLSRVEEEAIMGKLKARWEKEAAAAAEKKQAAAAGVSATGSNERPAVHTARDGTTIESLQEAEKTMIKDALAKASIFTSRY